MTSSGLDLFCSGDDASTSIGCGAESFVLAAINSFGFCLLLLRRDASLDDDRDMSVGLDDEPADEEDDEEEEDEEEELDEERDTLDDDEEEDEEDDLSDCVTELKLVSFRLLFISLSLRDSLFSFFFFNCCCCFSLSII